VNDDQLTGRELDAWRTFLSSNVQLIERLDHELQQRSRITLTDYEILSALASAPGNRLRMSDLAREVLVSRSRLTYRVDRLAEVAFVTREECEDDRRGLWAILTQTGQEALTDATAEHRNDLRNWFFDQMSEDELATLTSVMGRIDEKLAKNSHRVQSRA
jgi:DNA-binding MarR family transcriptional regulator